MCQGTQTGKRGLRGLADGREALGVTRSQRCLRDVSAQTRSSQAFLAIAQSAAQTASGSVWVAISALQLWLAATSLISALRK